MEPITCDVIKDLLPLYVDQVCSESTNNLVEEHLSNCEVCREMYHNLQEKLPLVTIPENEDRKREDEKFISGIRHEFTMRQVVVFGIAVIAAMVLFWVIPELQHRTTGEDFLDNTPFDPRVPIDDITVTELYELKDGSIFYTLESNRKINNCRLPGYSLGEDDAFDPYSETVQTYDKGGITISIISTFWDRVLRPNTIYFLDNQVSFVSDVIDSRETNIEVKNITDISYIGKGGREKVIWKKGQSLQAAPESVEKRVEIEKQNLMKEFDYIGSQGNYVIAHESDNHQSGN